MSPRTRGVVTYVVIAVIVFALSGLGGFVYGHEPQRDLLDVRVTTAGAPAATEQIESGTVIAVDGSTLLLDSGASFDVPPIAEALVPATGEQLPEGTLVNIGGDVTRNGLVLTGVVAIDEAAATP